MGRYVVSTSCNALTYFLKSHWPSFFSNLKTEMFAQMYLGKITTSHNVRPKYQIYNSVKFIQEIDNKLRERSEWLDSCSATDNISMQSSIACRNCLCHTIRLNSFNKSATQNVIVVRTIKFTLYYIHSIYILVYIVQTHMSTSWTKISVLFT